MSDERATARPLPRRADGPDNADDRRPLERPNLDSPNGAPVIVKQPPPFLVRVSQLLWVLSLISGAVLVVYYFVVRETQLPLIIEAVRSVDGSRKDETYSRAADIIFWAVFWCLIALLFFQISLMVSFMNRKDGVRWWQFFTILGQLAIFALANEMVAKGDHGPMLRQMFMLQGGLALSALLISALPGPLRWTARRHDIRKRTVGSPGSEV